MDYQELKKRRSKRDYIILLVAIVGIAISQLLELNTFGLMFVIAQVLLVTYLLLKLDKR